jgi:hypothetical protein
MISISLSILSFDLHGIVIGSLPPEWKGMISMQYMYLSSNNLNGESQRCREVFTHSQYHIDESCFPFIIKIGSFPNWTGMASLIYLQLYNNQLMGMKKQCHLSLYSG